MAMTSEEQAGLEMRLLLLEVSSARVEQKLAIADLLSPMPAEDQAYHSDKIEKAVEARTQAHQSVVDYVNKLLTR